ncbi:hypothetical protein GF325_09445 [Candidatus Bathyarchaeota archaeon]|nr:hypothetical protein [Candidatus Bathyarchaeota archaeon]
MNEITRESSKTGEKKQRKKKLAVAASIIAIMATSIYPVIACMFHDNGTVQRSTWFIKPTSGELPYILMEDLVSVRGNGRIEWMHHGRTNLDIAHPDQGWTFSAKDYLDGTNVSLHCQMITAGITLESGTGFASVNGSEREAPWLQATTAGSQVITTVMIPRNGTDPLPTIDVQNSSKSENAMRLLHPGTVDYFWTAMKPNGGIMGTVMDSLKATASACLVRINGSGSMEAIAFRDAMRVQNGSTSLFSANSPVSGCLTLVAGNISGTIHTRKQGTILSLAMPDPGIITINGSVLDPSKVSHQAGILSLEPDMVGELVIGSQQANPPSLERTLLPRVSGAWCISRLEEMDHPYLLFNASSLPALVAGWTGSGNLSLFYSDLESRAINYEKEYVDATGKLNITEGKKWKSGILVLWWALDYLQTGNATKFDYLKQFFQFLPEFVFLQRQDLDISFNGFMAAIALDVIAGSLDAGEMRELGGHLEQFVKPLDEARDILPMNNHLALGMGAVGCVGIVTKNAMYIQHAIDAFTQYFDNVLHDGVPVESFIYSSYGSIDSAFFTRAMTRLGFIDYFIEGSPLDRFMNRSITVLNPVGSWPNYEDSSIDGSLLLRIRLYSHLTSNELLRQHVAYFINIQGDSSQFEVGSSSHKILELFTWKPLASPAPPAVKWLSWASRKGGIACLRTGWDADAVFISMNAKTFHQSHTRLDELSFEICAYGALLSMNTGYPGWKKEHHAYTVSTMGSNTILLGGEDQQRETCGGIGFVALSNATDIITMDSGALYTHPFHPLSNPILLVMIISIQGMMVLLAVTTILRARHQVSEIRAMAENEAQVATSRNSIDYMEVESASTPSVKGNFMKCLEGTRQLLGNALDGLDSRLAGIQATVRWPRWTFLAMLHAFFTFRIWSFFSSIMRKLQQWRFSPDKQLIDIILLVTWLVIFITPIIPSLACRRFSKNVATIVQDDSVKKKFPRRWVLATISTAPILMLVSWLAWSKDRFIMDLFSKSFGTIAGAATGVLQWFVFHWFILAGLNILVLILVLLVIRGSRTGIIRRVLGRILILSAIMLLAWLAIGMVLHGMLNAFTIETFFV